MSPLPDSWQMKTPDGGIMHYQPVPEAQHPDVQKLLAFWREREAAGGFVVGRDIPSRALAGVLHSIMIHEPLADSDFQIRIAGSALRRRYGMEITGRKLSELFGPDFEPQLAWTRHVLATGEPCILDVKEQRLGQTRLHREVIVLRVLAPGRATHWVLAGVFYFD
jgi:hypothetical protein